jgi:hypothetical protein
MREESVQSQKGCAEEMGRGEDLAGWSVAACDIGTLSRRVLIAERYRHPGNGVKQL